MWRLSFVSAVFLVTPAGAATGPDEPPAAKAEDLAYSRSLDKRATEVLDELRIADPEVAGRVRTAIIDQYRGLRALHDARDAKIREIKAQADRGEAGQADRIEAERSATEKASSSLNDRFLADLARDLSPAQVETVKDKMTYHKLQVTYNGYLEMLPQLTPEQKRVIHDNLTQARDRAMYAGSSEEKSAIFDKYKGRTNNYLSAQGYDLKQASKDWAERRKSAK